MHVSKMMGLWEQQLSTTPLPVTLLLVLSGIRVFSGESEVTFCHVLCPEKNCFAIKG
jgi:hypothetical protein